MVRCVLHPKAGPARSSCVTVVMLRDYMYDDIWRGFRAGAILHSTVWITYSNIEHCIAYEEVFIVLICMYHPSLLERHAC